MNEKFMLEAIRLAKKAYKQGEIPIGAVIVKDNKIISKAYNLRQTKKDVTMHAEIIAIKKACKKLKSWHLDNCDIYITLEPCYMCAGAIISARISNCYYGASNLRFGSISGECNLFSLKHNHHVNAIGGILESESSQIITDFFSDIRKNKK